jgi:hypothetical protein
MLGSGWEMKKRDYIKGCAMTTVTGSKVAELLLFLALVHIRPFIGELVDF